MRYIIFLLLLFVFSACEQEELPIIPHTSGEVLTQQIELESDYRNQIFYKLDGNMISSSNLKVDWDMAFESSVDGWRILVNSSTFSQVGEFQNIDFFDVNTVNNIVWKWDNPEGIYEGTAIGDYRSSNNIYIIDRGYTLNGNSRGYRKIMIDTVTEEYYQITYSKLDNTDINTLKITKNSNYNFTYFSFTNDSIVNIEPNYNQWDLCFTQYTHLFPDNEETPSYLVTGVLTNYLNDISVAIDSVSNFDDINYEMISMYEFNNQQDDIGYNWKYYDFDNEIYNVHPYINYIIKNQEERYFKLHFLDFYNNNGEKGYPLFEIQEL